MNSLLDTVRAALGATGTWVIPVALGIVVALALAALITAAMKLRGKSVNVKKTIGMGIVQAGTSYIIITGVYGFFAKVWNLPSVEAWILAVVVEAATWAGVGQIYSYAQTETVDAKGRKEPATGWGKGGPFFWFTILGGGTLAVLGSGGFAVAAGRMVIVSLGAWMWYLVISSVTRPKTGRSQWRWTPRRLLIAVGALAPTGADLADDARAWQVARMVRAMRRRNSRWPLSWWGKRTLARLGDRVPEDVQGAAMRWYAAGLVLVEATAADSELMRSAKASVGTAQAVAVITAPLVVPSEVGAAIGPRRREREDPPVSEDPPVEAWQKAIDAPVSPAVGGAGLTERQQIDAWRGVYGDAILYIKDVWRDGLGRDWATADDPPGLNQIVRIMAGWPGGKWNSKGTCQNFVKVIVADRAELAGVDRPSSDEVDA